MKFTGESRSTRGKTCPSATLSTTNPTWTDRGSNPGLRGERPASNRLSHGTANEHFTTGGKNPALTKGQNAGRTPKPQLDALGKEKCFILPGIKPRFLGNPRRNTSHYTD
jgi:hypothetical protein